MAGEKNIKDINQGNSIVELNTLSVIRLFKNIKQKQLLDNEIKLIFRDILDAYYEILDDVYENVTINKIVNNTNI